MTMRDKIKIIIACVLFISGLILLGITYTPFLSENPHNTKFERSVNVNLELRELYKEITFYPNSYGEIETKVGLIFILKNRVCPSCINEVAEFANLAREKDIESLVLVKSEETRKAEHFINVIKIPANTAYVHKDDLHKLNNFYIRGEFNNKMLVVDTEEGRIFHEVYIPSSGIRSIENKQSILKNAILSK